jgi:hypothetical protein
MYYIVVAFVLTTFAHAMILVTGPGYCPVPVLVYGRSAGCLVASSNELEKIGAEHPR